MSDPLLDKMDALLKKHQGPTETSAPAAVEPSTTMESNAPPPLPDDAWLPVLTEVVAIGEPEAPAPVATIPAAIAETAAEAPPPPPAPTVDPEALIEQIMGDLEPRLSSLLRDRLVMEIRNSLDDSLASLLAQLHVHVREIVREAVAEQLGKS